MSRLEPSGSVIDRMEVLSCSWEAASDDRALFLRCYQMMSANTLRAVQHLEFVDSEWVGQLLHRFADYYFDALELYEQDPASAPVVWREAHDATQSESVWPLQKLLLGVNAHINYDLALALYDLLSPEWDELTEAQRAARYADHCQINQIIAQTIDAVQDNVLHRAMPSMRVLDVVLGSLDERLISLLLTRWRETVWRNAHGLIQARDPDTYDRQVQGVMEGACRMALRICPEHDLRSTA